MADMVTLALMLTQRYFKIIKYFNTLRLYFFAFD